MTTEQQQDDTRQINEAVQRAWNAGGDIDDALARSIAGRLGAGSRPLYDFAATGAISAELLMQLDAVSEETDEPAGIWAAALIQYCRLHGLRGPLPGWGLEPQP